jgi:hypothetical protein
LSQEPFRSPWSATQRSCAALLKIDAGGTPPRGLSGTAKIPALVVTEEARRHFAEDPDVAERVVLCQRFSELRQLLALGPVPALMIETRDADGVPVPAGIRGWVERNPGIPVVVWTSGSAGALREVLDLSAVGGDVRLVFRPRDEPAAVLKQLLASPAPSPSAAPWLLRGVVVPAPEIIRPELTLAAYHAWPRPSVKAWADAVGVTRQALDRRLSLVRYRTASVILHHFTAAEIAIRLAHGERLRDIAAVMDRHDERSLRRRLVGVGTRPEHLRDEADFRALIPRIAAGIRLE